MGCHIIFPDRSCCWVGVTAGNALVNSLEIVCWHSITLAHYVWDIWLYWPHCMKKYHPAEILCDWIGQHYLIYSFTDHWKHWSDHIKILFDWAKHHCLVYSFTDHWKHWSDHGKILCDWVIFLQPCLFPDWPLKTLIRPYKDSMTGPHNTALFIPWLTIENSGQSMQSFSILARHYCLLTLTDHCKFCTDHAGILWATALFIPW